MQYVCRTAILPKLQKLCFCTLLLYVKIIFFLFNGLSVLKLWIILFKSSTLKRLRFLFYLPFFFINIIARFWKLEIAFPWKARTFSACNWHCQFEMSPVLLTFGVTICIWCYHITINKYDTFNRKHIRINFKNNQTGILLRVRRTYRIADEKHLYFLHILMGWFVCLFSFPCLCLH